MPMNKAAMTKLPTNLWIVIPVFNEATYLDRVLSKVKKYTTHIIVVDDGSSDDSVTIAQQHTKYVLQHSVNLGKGAALKTGCEFAFKELNAEEVITMDSDDQHDPAELPDFAEALKSSPMVFGVRGFAGMPTLRVYGNKLLSSLTAILFGSYIPDILSGYKAFNRQTYDQIDWTSSEYGVELEIAVKVAHNRIPFAIIPIKTIYHDMDRGMTVLDALGIMSHIISWRISL